MDPIQRAIRAQIRQRHPNMRSKFATPASRRVDLHYVNLHLLDRWTWERYQRLAQALRLTSYELASVVCLPHQHVTEWRAKTKMPLGASQGAYAVALVLTILENHVMGQLLNDTIPNPFPNLNKV